MGVTPTLRGCIMKSSGGSSLAFQQPLAFPVVHSHAFLPLASFLSSCYICSSLTPNIHIFASLEKGGKMNISLAPSPVADICSSAESSSWRDITKKIPEIAFVSSRILLMVPNFYSKGVIPIILRHCSDIK